MCLSRFLGDARGNVAMIFTLSVLPIIMAVGAAVDYARINDTTEVMQHALDATVLALSNDVDSLSATQLTTKANTLFLANFNASNGSTGEANGVSNVNVAISYSRTNGALISASATAKIDLSVLAAVGIDSKNLKVTSRSSWSTSNLRVSLVLDNTGSMKDNGKMTALKTAAHNLLDQLKKASVRDGDVYVSIVPFAKDVNIGASNYNATWLDWTDWDSKNYTRTSQRTCVYYGWFPVCSTTYVNTPNAHSTWTGCVTDRTRDYDTKNTTPTSTATYFVPEQYADCGTKVTPLTYNWTTLSAAVDAMTPLGATNQTVGLAVGWQTLTTGVPFNAPAKTAGIEYKDVIILLTDGINTQNRAGGDGVNQWADADNRMKIACTNAKTAGVTIYTVLVLEGNASLLQSCASSPSSTYFFNLTDPTQIITTFGTIGNQLSKLHLSG